MAEGAIALPSELGVAEPVEPDLGIFADVPAAPARTPVTPPVSGPVDVDLGIFEDAPDLSPTPVTDRETGMTEPEPTPDLGIFADVPEAPKPIGAATAEALAATPTFNPLQEEIKPTPYDQGMLNAMRKWTEDFLAPGQDSGQFLISPESADFIAERMGLPARVVAKGLEKLTGLPYAEAEKGFEEAGAAAIHGFTSLEGIASLANPFMLEAFAINTITNLPDQFGRIKEAVKKHGFISRETAKAFGEAGIADVLGWLAGRGARVTKLKQPVPRGGATDIMRKQLAGKEPQIAGPALVDDAGKVLAAASVGFSHSDLLGKAVGTPMEEAVMAAFLKDENHKFIDAEGNVWNREQAANIAVRAGQVPKDVTRLQSEYLIKGNMERLTALRQEGLSAKDAASLVSGEKTVEEVIDSNFKKYVRPAFDAGVAEGHAEAMMQGYKQAIERLNNILKTGDPYGEIKGGEPSATEKIKQPESVQAELEDRTARGEEKETGPSDRIQRAEEGGPEEIDTGVGVHAIDLRTKGNPLGLRAAFRNADGTIQVGLPGQIHADMLRDYSKGKALPGFVDQAGNFLTRDQATKAVAEAKRAEEGGPEEVTAEPPKILPRAREAEPVSKPSEQLAKETPSEPGIAAPAVELAKTYYHGSFEKLEGALRPGLGKNAARFLHEEGIWFAPNRGKDFNESWISDATRYSGDEGTIIHAKLNLKNPYYGSVNELVRDKINAKWLKDNGYDGFIDNKTGSGLVVVLDSAQIRELHRETLPGIAAPAVEPAPAPEPHAVESGGAMGAAKFGEVERGREPISMANAAVDARREAEGREPIFSEARQADPLLWDQAMARIDRNPNAPAMLVDAINAGEIKAASPVEQMMLLHEEIRLQNEKAQESVRARDDSLGEDIQAEHRANYAAAERRLDATERANRAYGTIAGRALRSRRIAAFDDFTLAAMETRARNAKGGPLTEAESLKIEAQAKEIETLKAEIAARPDVDAMAVMRTLMAEQARELRGAAKAGGFVQAMHSARDAAIKRSLERRRQGRLYSGVDPQALLDAVIIGAAHIADGVRDFGAWSKKMLDDLGEGVRDTLDDLFKRSKQYHDANEKAAKPKAPKGAKPKPTAMDRIAKQSQEGKPLGQKAIYDRMREHINEGMVEGMEPNKALDTLIEAVKADLKDIFPDVTKVEIRDAFTEYGKQQIPSKEKDRVQLREYRRLGQLRSSIERVLAGKRPLKTGFLRDKPTQAIREGMKELNDAMREAGFESTGPEQLASRNVARETSLRNQIADIEKELATGERRKPAEPVPDTPRVKELRARRDELRKQLEEARKADPGFEAARDRALLQRYKTYLDNKTATLKERIKKGDYAKVEKKAKVLDKEAKQKKFRLSEVQKEFNRGVLELKLKNRTGLEKVLGGAHQTLNLMRNMITTADLSAVLRQGGFIVLGHPVRGAQAMGPMLRAFASEKQRFEIMEGIRHDENFGFAEQAGLFIQDERGIDLLKQEEQFMGRWAQALADLPKKAVVGIPFKLVTASERAYTTFLNKLRMDSFNAMIKTAGRAGHEITLKEAKAIANFINVATGRGNLEGVAKAAANLNGIFFAPRYVASRFQLLLGEPMFRGSGLTRKMIGEEYGRALIGIMTVYGLGKLAGGEIETDRRSSDFGKIRFGNTRVDPMFGLSQTAVLINRIKSGESKQLGGKVVPLTGKVPFGGQTLDDVMWRFFRSKLSPAAGSAVNIVRGQDVVGNPVTPMSELFHNITPLAFQDVSKAMQDQGIARGTALGALAIFGMGLQTYTPRNPEKLPTGTTTKSKSKPYVP